MGVQGYIGTDKNKKFTMKTKAFDKIESASSATHLKYKDSEEFVEISEDLVIKRKKEGPDGKPQYEDVHFSEINSSEEFVLVKGDKEFPLSGDFYAQIAFMKKCEGDKKGPYLRCEDGVYIHADEIQIPAYKKVDVGEGSELRGPIRDGSFYVEQQIAIVNEPGVREGVKVVITDENRHLLTKSGEDWLFDGKECVVKQGLDTRVKVEQVLIDGKIVDVEKIKTDDSGRLIVDVEGVGPIETQKTVELQSPFVALDNADYEDEFIEEYVTADNVNIKTGRALERSGSVRIGEVNVPRSMRDSASGKTIHASSNSVRFGDGDEAVTYALYGVPVYQSKGQVYRVKSISALHHSMRDSGASKSGRYSRYEFDFEDPQAVDLKYLNTEEELARTGPTPQKIKKEYYPAGNKKIENIKWNSVDGVDQVVSYEMNGVVFDDIVWEGGEVKSCTVKYTNETGDIVSEKIDNIKQSTFKNLAIKCNQIDRLENVKINDDATIAFRLGNYEFKDAVLDEDGKIGKCKLKINDGEFEDVDLTEDSRFEKLRMSINNILIDQKIVPLVRSKLYEKKDGKYQRVADVVQTEEMNNGVAAAEEVQTVDQAVKAQNKFNENRFTTVVIDEKNPNNIHVISDFKTTYEGVTSFEYDKSLIPDLIGKDKIECKKGEITIDAKKTKDYLTDFTVVGLGLCGQLVPFGMLIGVPLLMGAIVGAAITSMARKAKINRINNTKIEDVVEETHKNLKKQVKSNINKLTKQCARAIKAAKKILSEEEFKAEKARILQQYRYDYDKEIGRLQLLGGGTVTCGLNPSEKTKLTASNELAYLEYRRLRKEFEEGKVMSKKQSKLLEEAIAFQTKDTKGLDSVEAELQVLDSWAKEGKLGMSEHRRIYALKKKKAASIEDKNQRADFLKNARLEFNAARNSVGGIQDKLEAFKESLEYQSLDSNGKKEALKAKAEELEKKKKSISVENIKLGESLGKDGKPEVENVTRDVTAYREYAIMELDKGKTSLKHDFDYGFHDKLSQDEQDLYTPEQTLSQASARVVGNTSQRLLKYDRNRTINQTNVVIQETENLRQKVEAETTRITEKMKNATYEELVALEALAYKQRQLVADEGKRLVGEINSIPNLEINQDGKTDIISTVKQITKPTVQTPVKLLAEKQSKEAEYRREVAKRTTEELQAKYRREFEAEISSDPKRKNAFSKLSKTKKREQFEHFIGKKMESVDGQKSEFEAEKEVLLVKNNITDNIRAEVLAEQQKADYDIWIMTQNDPKLDPNSEIAKCKYYVHCRSKNPKAIDDFNKLSEQACRDKAVERLEQGTLLRKDKVEEQQQKQEENQTQEQNDSKKLGRKAKKKQNKNQNKAPIVAPESGKVDNLMTVNETEVLTR